MSSGPVFNQQNEGDGNQNVQGVEVNFGSIHNAPKGDSDIDVSKFFAVLAAPKAMPDDVAEEVVPKLQTLAELPPEEQKKAMDSEEWLGVVKKLKPHAATIGKTLAVFGSAALKSLADRNPICAGVVAVCNQFSDKE